MTSTMQQLDINDLAAAVAGPVLIPGTAGYDQEVIGFNVAHRPAPAIVVGATNHQDVSAAVQWADQRGLRVSAQATGHGLVSDLTGTVMISTRRMADLEIDPVSRTARVGAGVRWRAVIDAASPYGLAPLNGSASSVGVVGYTLGGGTGPMARQYGFAADHVRSLKIVTADGALRTVSADQHPDLFWAVRGGKLGFGVVSEIEFDLVPVARFYGGGIFFPGEAAAAVLHAWRSWAPMLPNEVSTSVALLRLPLDPQLPPPLRGQFAVHLRYTHLGDPGEAERLLAPMRTIAPVLIDAIGEMPYTAVDSVHMDPTSPVPCHDRGLTLAEFPAAAVDALVAADGVDSGSVLILAEVRLLGGAMAAAPAVPNAVASRNAAYSVYVLGVPAGPTASLVSGQVDAVVDALAPWRSGGLINFLGHTDPALTGTIWSDADRRQLRQTALRYDPNDTFGGSTVFGAIDG